MPLVLQRTPRKLTLRERLLVLWVIKQKLLQQKEGKCSAIDTSAMKGMFEGLFFGTYRSLAILRGHSGGVRCLALYGDKLFSGGRDSTIRVWNADTHVTIRLWNADDHEYMIATCEGHSGDVWCLALHGNRLFSGGGLGVPLPGGGDPSICVWNAATLEHLATLRGHNGGVVSLALHGNKLFSGGFGDNTIRVWNADTHELMATLEGHCGTVWCLALYGDKLFSAGGYQDGTIRVWNADTHEHLATFEGHSGPVRCLALYRNKLLSGGGYDRTIYVWNAEEV
jgi:WD40 repeat protein